jgi:hypothetical protein
VSGAATRFTAALFTDHANAFWLSAERSKNSAGVDTADSLLLGFGVGGGPHNFIPLPATGGVPTLSTKLGSALPASVTLLGADVIAFPVIPYAGASLYPGKNLMVWQSPDFTPDSNYSLTIYGAAVTYRALPSSISALVRSAPNNERLMIRYD